MSAKLYLKPGEVWYVANGQNALAFSLVYILSVSASVTVVVIDRPTSPPTSTAQFGDRFGLSPMMFQRRIFEKEKVPDELLVEITAALLAKEVD